MFSRATTTGAGPGSRPSSSAVDARVGEQTLLERGIHPGAGDEPSAVGGRAGDEPVDPLAHVLPLDDALLDEQLLERPNARSGPGSPPFVIGS